MRGRGLKPFYVLELEELLLSLPMRGRGLKHNDSYGVVNVSTVAPHAGAWIETCQVWPNNIFQKGRSPCGGVD